MIATNTELPVRPRARKQSKPRPFKLTPAQKAATPAAVNALTVGLSEIAPRVALEGTRAVKALQAARAWWTLYTYAAKHTDTRYPLHARKLRTNADRARSSCEKLLNELRHLRVKNFPDLVALAVLTVAFEAFPEEETGSIAGFAETEGALALSILELVGISPSSIFPAPIAEQLRRRK